jgi:hypothetical protein
LCAWQISRGAEALREILDSLLFVRRLYATSGLSRFQLSWLWTCTLVLSLYYVALHHAYLLVSDVLASLIYFVRRLQ